MVATVAGQDCQVRQPDVPLQMGVDEIAHSPSSGLGSCIKTSLIEFSNCAMKHLLLLNTQLLSRVTTPYALYSSLLSLDRHRRVTLYEVLF